MSPRADSLGFAVADTAEAAVALQLAERHGPQYLADDDRVDWPTLLEAARAGQLLIIKDPAGLVYGFVLAVPARESDLELHTVLYPTRLSTVVRSGVLRAMAQWLLDNGWHTLHAWVPDWQHQAMGLLLGLGFRHFGVRDEVLRKQGKWRDLHGFELKAGDIERDPRRHAATYLTKKLHKKLKRYGY